MVPTLSAAFFRSTDGGLTWRKTLFVDNDTGAITVERDPQHPPVLFAAMLQTRRPPWNVYPPSKGPGSGLFKSTDGGSTWTALRGHGFPAEGLGRIGVAVAPTNADRVYAIVDATDGGLYRSEDGGATWKHVDAERRIWQRGWYFEEVAVDPHDADTVYVSNTALYRSTDGGATFTAIKGAPGGDDYHMLWLDPHDSDRMILASDQGVIVSVDGAQTWSSWYNQPTAQLYHISADTRFPFWVYGAQQDAGAIGLASRGLGRGITQADTLPLDVGGESDNIAPDPLHSDVLFGSRVEAENLTTHSVRVVSPTLAHPGTWRVTWTLPLAFSVLDPGVLYASRQVLFRTANGGDTWQIISGDLTRAAPGVPPNLDAPTAADVDDPTATARGVIYAIAPSPLRRSMIWVGTDDGYLQLTRDEGATWRNVTPTGLSAWSKIGIIEASHFDAETAYAAVDRHRLDDLHPYILRTHDGGQTWRNAVAGIPAASFVNAVREDPQRRGLLYAGTETGVYVSLNDGDVWQPLQLNLPAASVRDLVVRDDALAIATHGRSLWILDDVTPLRQMNATTLAAPAWLFTPQTAYRMRRFDDEGTPQPPEEPAGENPPDGAILDYAVGPRGARTVLIQVLDARGAVRRTWSSADAPPPVNPRDLEFPAFWVPTPAVPAATPGLHRFVWDLHDAPQPHLASGDAEFDPFEAHGNWVVPGAYRVRLTVDGRSMERPLHVLLDPREPVAAGDLAAQAAFAAEIETVRAAVLRAAHGFALPRPVLQKLSAVDGALGVIEADSQSGPRAPTDDEREALVQQRAALAAVSTLLPTAPP